MIKIIFYKDINRWCVVMKDHPLQPIISNLRCIDWDDNTDDGDIFVLPHFEVGNFMCWLDSSGVEYDIKFE